MTFTEFMGNVFIYILCLWMAAVGGMWLTSFFAKTDDWVSPIIAAVVILGGGAIIGLIGIGWMLAQ